MSREMQVPGMVVWQWRRQNVWRLLVIIAIALSLVLTATAAQSVWAQSPSLETLQQQRDQLDEQIKVYDEADQRFRKAEEQTNQNLRDLSKTIQSTDAWITNTEYQLAEAERKLTQLEADFERNQQDYEQARTAVVGRLQFMQRQQNAQGWALLLQSENLNDFLDRRYRLKQVYKADRANLISLDEASADLVAQQQGVEQQKNAIALLRQQLLVSRDQYTAQMQQQSTLVARLQQNRGALAAAIDQLDKESDEITSLILQRVAEAGAADGKIAREEALRAARASGKMLYPSSGPITSHFGSRFHPVLGYSRVHAGTELGAATRAPIGAARTGGVMV
ncbi:MAG: peptidase M23, partial [Cyanobacteria bacterium P01_F01_bin.3]